MLPLAILNQKHVVFMGSYKVHSHAGVKAYYVKLGRKWIVEDGDKKIIFNNVSEMVKKYPDLTEVPAIQMAIDRKTLAKKEVVLASGGKGEEVVSKIVTCYYCSGKGVLASGLPCPNCGGVGWFEVSTRGLG